MRTLMITMTVVTFCSAGGGLPDDDKPRPAEERTNTPPQNLHDHNTPEKSGCDPETFVKLAAPVATVMLAGYLLWNELSPANRAERGTTHALNYAHKNWDLGAGMGKVSIDVDDILHLSIETNRLTSELIKFLGEDANYRKLRNLGTIEKIRIVRDRRDQGIQRDYFDSTIVTVLISSDGDRASWRTTLEDFAKHP